MPPGGTLVSSTFMPMVPAGSVGVGVGTGLGEGLGVGVGPIADTLPPPQPHDPTRAITSKNVESLPRGECPRLPNFNIAYSCRGPLKGLTAEWQDQDGFQGSMPSDGC